MKRSARPHAGHSPTAPSGGEFFPTRGRGMPLEGYLERRFLRLGSALWHLEHAPGLCLVESTAANPAAFVPKINTIPL
jgi:hypothetical protein